MARRRVVLGMGLLCAIHAGAQQEPETPLTLARRAYREGVYTVSVQYAREELATTNTASRAEATSILLESLAHLTRTNELAEALMAGVVPPGEDVQLYWQARLALLKGDASGGRKLLVGFEEQYPDSTYLVDMLNVRALAAIAEGDLRGARAAMESFDEICTDPVRRDRNRLDLARAWLAGGDAAAAIKLIEPLLEREGTFGVLARYWRARAGLQIPKVRDEAVAALTLLAGDVTVPGDLRAGASLALADAAMTSGDAAGAVDVLQKCLSWFPDEHKLLRTELMRDLASVLLELGKLEEAVALVREVVAADAESVVSGQLLLELASRQLASGSAEQAHASYQSYLETFAFPEGEAVATAGRAAALMAMGKYAHAAADFERAAALFNDGERKQASVLKTGEALVANEQSGLAASHFRRIVEEWPQSTHVPRALFLLGIGCSARGEHEQADRYFTRVAESYPDRAEAEESLFSMARIHEQKRDWKGAEEQFTVQLERFPEGLFAAHAYYGRGRARYERGADGALEDLAKAEALGKGDSVEEKAVFLRAMTLYRLGRDAEALTLCKGFAERFPRSEWTPRVHYWVGTFLFNSARYEEAEAVFVDFVKIFPSDSLADAAQFRAGVSAAQQREFVRANDYFGQLATRYPESKLLADARFRQGEALSELGEFGAAILAFDEVVNEYPESDLVGQAWGHKGDCQFMLGATEPKRYEESMASFRVVTQIPGMALEDLLEAEYKMGRCLQQLGQGEAALNQFYGRVMVPFLDAQSRGEALSESAKLWFVRAAERAADHLEAVGEWRQMGRVLEHVAAAGVSSSDEARRRAKQVRQEHWWDFL